MNVKMQELSIPSADATTDWLSCSHPFSWNVVKKQNTVFSFVQILYTMAPVPITLFKKKKKKKNPTYCYF